MTHMKNTWVLAIYLAVCAAMPARPATAPETPVARLWLDVGLGVEFSGLLNFADEAALRSSFAHAMASAWGIPSALDVDIRLENITVKVAYSGLFLPSTDLTSTEAHIIEAIATASNVSSSVVSITLVLAKLLEDHTRFLAGRQPSSTTVLAEISLAPQPGIDVVKKAKQVLTSVPSPTLLATLASVAGNLTALPTVQTVPSAVVSVMSFAATGSDTQLDGEDVSTHMANVGGSMIFISTQGENITTTTISQEAALNHSSLPPPTSLLSSLLESLRSFA